jgi:tripartite-type tricarboxylate transporter receptor subunit TctC
MAFNVFWEREPMKLPHRRQFLHLAAGAAALPAVPRIASAQAYPTRPVRVLVGWPAGGAVDIIARLMAQSLSERLGQQFIVENRPGAGGNIATGAVVRAAGDGYTLLQITMADAINVTLYEKLKFNFSRDIAPIASVCRGSGVMVVNPSFPAKTIPEFIAHAKANPGKISMASAGAGTPAHLTGELFKIMTGVDMLHVPYRGSAPALTNLLGGEVQVVFADLPSSIEYIKASKLRPLAITSAARLEVLPDVPTLTEFLPGCEASAWHGIGAPQGTPTAVIETLRQAINASLADPRLRTRIANVGYEAYASSSSEFSNLIAAETEKWRKVIRAANIKPE